jgi:hypothetical protein
VNFTFQRVNQNLALIGSRSERTWVTLDMKEASDRVSLKLVDALFGDTPIYAKLLATRSTSTLLPTGERVKLNKFAPMGSALCFPVESLCFFALAVCAITRRRRRSQTNRDLRTYGAYSVIDAARLVYVYGDDIVVMHEDYECVIEALESYHLLVNRTKCCTAGSYRESCGVDAFKGIIVTPTKFRRVPIWSKYSHNYLSWIEYSNSLWENGYTTCADYIRSTILLTHDVWTTPEKIGCPTFIREYVSRPVGSKRCKKRYNRNLQRIELAGTVATSHKEVAVSSSWCELLRCLPQMPKNDRGLGIRRLGKTISSVPIPEGIRASTYSLLRRVKLKRRWFPLYI